MEIGEIFDVDYSTMSQNRARLKAKLKSNPGSNLEIVKLKDLIPLLRTLFFVGRYEILCYKTLTSNIKRVYAHLKI